MREGQEFAVRVRRERGQLFAIAPLLGSFAVGDTEFPARTLGPRVPEPKSGPPWRHFDAGQDEPVCRESAPPHVPVRDDAEAVDALVERGVAADRRDNPMTGKGSHPR